MFNSIINNPRVLMKNLLNQDFEVEGKEEIPLEGSTEKSSAFEIDDVNRINPEAYAVQGQTQVTFQSLMSQIRETRKQQEIEAAIKKQEEEQKELYSYVERFDGYSDVYEEFQELELQAYAENMHEQMVDLDIKEFGFTNEMYVLSNQKDDLFNKLHYCIPYQSRIIKGESMLIGQGMPSIESNDECDMT